MIDRTPPTCSRHGIEKKSYHQHNRPSLQYYCQQCCRERLRATRNIGRGATPVSCAGAKESLKRYLDANWDRDTWHRLADLLTGCNAGLGGAA